MRVMLTASIPVERGNAAIRDGSMQTLLQHYLEILKPEAAYFVADDDGCRSAFIVFDMAESSDMTLAAEPFFQSLGAKVTFRPCMNAQDLAKGQAGIDRALREFVTVKT